MTRPAVHRSRTAQPLDPSTNCKNPTTSIDKVRNRCQAPEDQVLCLCGSTCELISPLWKSSTGSSRSVKIRGRASLQHGHEATMKSQSWPTKVVTAIRRLPRTWRGRLSLQASHPQSASKHPTCSPRHWRLATGRYDDRSLGFATTGNDSITACSYVALGSVSFDAANRWDVPVFAVQFWSSFLADLSVKFYYAKKKVTWEVMEGSRKKKIEFLWSTISSMKIEVEVCAGGVLHCCPSCYSCRPL